MLIALSCFEPCHALRARCHIESRRNDVVSSIEDYASQTLKRELLERGWHPLFSADDGKRQVEQILDGRGSTRFFFSGCFSL